MPYAWGWFTVRSTTADWGDSLLRQFQIQAQDTRILVKLEDQLCLRRADLEQERRPLLVEAEFYKNKPMPPKLKSKLEYIEVAADAQRTLVVNQQAELVRINGLYDEELARLKKLWDGALPGTVGPVPAAVSGANKKG